MKKLGLKDLFTFLWITNGLGSSNFLNVPMRVNLPVNFGRKKNIFKKSHTNANHSNRFYTNRQFHLKMTFLNVCFHDTIFSTTQFCWCVWWCQDETNLTELASNFSIHNLIYFCLKWEKPFLNTCDFDFCLLLLLTRQ